MNVILQRLDNPEISIVFRVHCWNNYGNNIGQNCPDLEISYYIECSEEIDFNEIKNRRKKRTPVVCQKELIQDFIQESFKNFKCTAL